MQAHKDLSKPTLAECISSLEQAIYKPTASIKEELLSKLRNSVEKNTGQYLSNADLNTIWTNIQNENLTNASKLNQANKDDLNSLSKHLSKLDREHLIQFFGFPTNSTTMRDEIEQQAKILNKSQPTIATDSAEYIELKKSIDDIKAATLTPDELMDKLSECMTKQKEIKKDPSRAIISDLYKNLEKHLLEKVYKIPGITRAQITTVLDSQKDAAPVKLSTIASSAITSHLNRQTSSTAFLMNTIGKGNAKQASLNISNDSQLPKETPEITEQKKDSPEQDNNSRPKPR